MKPLKKTAIQSNYNTIEPKTKSIDLNNIGRPIDINVYQSQISYAKQPEDHELSEAEIEAVKILEDLNQMSVIMSNKQSKE